MVAKFFFLIKDSAKQLFRKPLLFTPLLILLIVLTILSEASRNVNLWITRAGINSTPVLIIWLSFFVLLSLICIGSAFTFLFQLISSAPGKRTKSEEHIIRRITRVTSSLTLITLASIILLLIVYTLSFSIGKITQLSTNGAQILFILLLFVALAGLLIFTTYMPIYASLSFSTLKESFVRSKNTVRRKYLETLMILVLTFLVTSILDWLFPLNIVQGITLSSLIAHAFIYPIVAIILFRVSILKDDI